MNVPFFIAKRYFFTRKKKKFINWIALISVIGVAAGTAALIIVLSVFNGLENLLRSVYDTFDPDLKIEAAKGKSFEPSTEFLSKIRAIEGINYVAEIIEDEVLIIYNEGQAVAKMKGVPDDYGKYSQVAEAVIRGSFDLKNKEINFAVVGSGIESALSVSVVDSPIPMEFWYPRADKITRLNPETAFNKDFITPGGTFAVQKEYDDTYIFVPLDFAQELTGYGNARSYLEIYLNGKVSASTVQEELRAIPGNLFQVQTLDEQHESLLMAVKTEKLIGWLAFIFVLMIASVNIFFTLSMLILEKKEDTAVLGVLGASRSFIRRLFLYDGLLIGWTGALIGLIVGVGLVLIQKYLKIISLGIDTTIVDTYPVELKAQDVLFTCIIILTVTFIASRLPISGINKGHVKHQTL